MKKEKPFLQMSVYLTILLLSSCISSPPIQNEVIVHQSNDPSMLNPVNFTDAGAGYITNHMFQLLMDLDFRNPEQVIPVLAESRPQIEKTMDGKMLITYKLRQEARWDNGSPITAKDVEFSIKTIKCPLVNNPRAKPYFEFITDFKFYEDDPLKFTIVSNQIYILSEAASAEYAILPEYVYDPKGLLRNFTIKQIAEKGDSLKSNMQIKEFAEDFNSEKRARDPHFISGSGPYKFTEWKTNETIILTKKENWWGDALRGQDNRQENCYFEAFPKKLIYRVIKDPTTALVSLKAGNIDVMRSIKTKDFYELSQSEKFTQNFYAYKPMIYGYTLIGINTKNPLLSDKITRQALAHLVDVNKMIETIKYGLAERVVGPVHPSKKKAYHTTIIPYSFNPEKAKTLLEKAGWKNTNNDATLDKLINGKQTEFIIDFYFSAENEERKSIGLMLQQEAKKVGIKINIISSDGIVANSKYRKHEFDLMTDGRVVGPDPDDFKQTFHSESAADEGDNYFNFSNSEADALIDSIRTELNEDKRRGMYHRFQEILHEEVPLIFLWTPTERIAISKKFENAYPSTIKPGFWEQGFKIITYSN